MPLLRKVCEEESNPYKNDKDYKKLFKTDGKTRFFNSEIAEETNVWVKRFKHILMKMKATRHVFWLDVA